MRSLTASSHPNPPSTDPSGLQCARLADRGLDRSCWPPAFEYDVRSRRRDAVVDVAAAGASNSHSREREREVVVPSATEPHAAVALGTDRLPPEYADDRSEQERDLVTVVSGPSARAHPDPSGGAVDAARAVVGTGGPARDRCRTVCRARRRTRRPWRSGRRTSARSRSSSKQSPMAQSWATASAAASAPFWRSRRST